MPKKKPPIPRNGRIIYILAALMSLSIVFLFAIVIYAQVKT